MATASRLALLVPFLLPGPVRGQEAPARPPVFDQEHRVLDELLHEFVHEGGLVDYPGLRERGAVRLDGYLASLRRVRARDFRLWTTVQQEAFWINAYNAWTWRLVLDHWPVDSIKDIGSLFRSVFSKRFVPLQHLVGEHDDPLSLGEIEHEILARRFRSPLFHFAIVCASRSCPALRREAYVGDRLEHQLADQARRFLADPAKNDQRIVDGRLRLSKIFDWSEDELERFPGGIHGLLRRYGPPAVARDSGLDNARLESRDYDWSLNLWRPPARDR